MNILKYILQCKFYINIPYTYFTTCLNIEYCLLQIKSTASSLICDFVVGFILISILVSADSYGHLYN